MEQRYINYMRSTVLCLFVFCMVSCYAKELGVCQEEIAFECDEESEIVPTLEYDHRDAAINEFDELLEHTCAPHIPKWQLMLQQWGTQFITYIFYLKEQVTLGCSHAKIKICNLLNTK